MESTVESIWRVTFDSLCCFSFDVHKKPYLMNQLLGNNNNNKHNNDNTYNNSINSNYSNNSKYSNSNNNNNNHHHHHHHHHSNSNMILYQMRFVKIVDSRGRGSEGGGRGSASTY